MRPRGAARMCDRCNVRVVTNLETVWVKKRVAVAAREGTPAGPIITALALRDAAEDALRVEVGHCRDLGWSWTAIARHLNVTRQAARQKYGQFDRMGVDQGGDLPPVLDGL